MQDSCVAFGWNFPSLFLSESLYFLLWRVSYFIFHWFYHKTPIRVSVRKKIKKKCIKIYVSRYDLATSSVTYIFLYKIIHLYVFLLRSPPGEEHISVGQKTHTSFQIPSITFLVLSLWWHQSLGESCRNCVFPMPGLYKTSIWKLWNLASGMASKMKWMRFSYSWSESWPKRNVTHQSKKVSFLFSFQGIDRFAIFLTKFLGLNAYKCWVTHSTLIKQLINQCSNTSLLFDLYFFWTDFFFSSSSLPWSYNSQIMY